MSVDLGELCSVFIQGLTCACHCPCGCDLGVEKGKEQKSSSPFLDVAFFFLIGAEKKKSKQTRKISGHLSVILKAIKK